VPELSDFEFDLATEKLKTHKSSDINQIPAELIKAERRTIRYGIHELIVSIWNKEWKESITLPIYKKDDKTDCSNHRGISLLPTMYNILSNILPSKLTPNAEETTVVINVDFDANKIVT
jgi:hypothetical protein